MEQFLNTGFWRERAIFQMIIFVATFLATMIDLWTGVEAAKARMETIHSRGLRQSIGKYLDYWRFQVMALFIDLIGMLIPQYTIPYVSILVCIAIIVIEARSVMENMRSKKSNAGNIPDTIKEIINCTNAEKAKKLVEKFKTKNS